MTNYDEIYADIQIKFDDNFFLDIKDNNFCYFSEILEGEHSFYEIEPSLEIGDLKFYLKIFWHFDEEIEMNLPDEEFKTYKISNFTEKYCKKNNIDQEKLFEIVKKILEKNNIDIEKIVSEYHLNIDIVCKKYNEFIKSAQEHFNDIKKNIK